MFGLSELKHVALKKLKKERQNGCRLRISSVTKEPRLLETDAVEPRNYSHQPGHENLAQLMESAAGTNFVTGLNSVKS